MEYIYKNEDGKEENVEPERWGWGVVYRASEEEIAAGEERAKKLEIEGKEQVEAARRANEPEDKIEALAGEYDGKILAARNVSGGELRQFGLDGRFHRFAEIDQDRVQMFSMYQLEDMGKRVDILVKPGMQIFHFYRTIVFNYMRAPRRVKAYAFGWKCGQDTAYHFILPDDRIVMGNSDLNLENFEI